MVARLTSPFIVSLTLIGFCASCTFPRVQELKEYADIQAGTRTALLLRLTNEEVSGETSTTVLMGLGDFKTGGELELATLRNYPISSPSDEAAQQGWIFILLKPGVYYLGFVGVARYNNGIPFYSLYNALNTAQRWSIDIPEGPRLIYGGSVHLLCRKVKVPLDVTRCQNQQQVGVLKNEEALATNIVSEYIPELGLPKTLLLQRYGGGPIIIKKPK